MFGSEPNVQVHPDGEPEPPFRFVFNDFNLIWLNQTPNIMLGSGSNIVHNVQNLTMASLKGNISCNIWAMLAAVRLAMLLKGINVSDLFYFIKGKFCTFFC